VADRLSHSYRVALLDFRGHGRSPGALEEVSLAIYANDVPEVIRALGTDAAALIGFSLGGYVALCATAWHPQAVTALATIGGAARPAGPEMAAEIESGSWPDSLRELDHVAADDPDYWRSLRSKLVDEWTKQSLSDDELARISCPVLICQGADDPVQPDDAARHLAGAIPGAELVFVPDSGHAVQLAAPERFLELLSRFLERALRSPGPGTASPGSRATAPPSIRLPAS
jgi:pimeloyl-ACP methyl ester carboxylesterase